MTNRFLISAAVAALIAGTGFANAQGTGTSREQPSAGSAQQNAPSSERGGAMHRDSGMKGAESTKGSDSKDMKGAESTKGPDSKDMKASESNEKKPSSKSAQDTPRGEKSKSMSSETETKGGKDMKAEGRDSKTGNMNAETKGATDSKTGGNMNAQTKSQTTTGNAATSATAAPPVEKQTQITSAIRSEKIQETTNVNFNISVGAVVPANVRFHPLPSRIVEIYPEWRGYEVILVHGRYIIVRPRTHEIVYIIEG